MNVTITITSEERLTHTGMETAYGAIIEDKHGNFYCEIGKRLKSREEALNAAINFCEVEGLTIDDYLDN